MSLADTISSRKWSNASSVVLPWPTLYDQLLRHISPLTARVAVVVAVAAAVVVAAVAAVETLGTSIEDGTRRALSSRTCSTRDPRAQLAHPTHS
jgi:hypothetical protein